MNKKNYFIYHRSLRWGYAQTLRKDATKVGVSRAVPEQLLVV